MFFETSFQWFSDIVLIVEEFILLLIVAESETLDTIIKLALALHCGRVGFNRIPLDFNEFFVLKSKDELVTVLFNQFWECFNIVDDEGHSLSF